MCDSRAAFDRREQDEQVILDGYGRITAHDRRTKTDRLALFGAASPWHDDERRREDATCKPTMSGRPHLILCAAPTRIEIQTPRSAMRIAIGDDGTNAHRAQVTETARRTLRHPRGGARHDRGMITGAPCEQENVHVSQGVKSPGRFNSGPRYAPVNCSAKLPVARATP